MENLIWFIKVCKLISQILGFFISKKHKFAYFFLKYTELQKTIFYSFSIPYPYLYKINAYNRHPLILQAPLRKS